MNSNEIFRENIRHLRRVHAMTLAQMAAVMGIGPGTLGRLEAGKMVRLHAGHLVRVCDYFDLPADSLLLRNLKDGMLVK